VYKYLFSLLILSVIYVFPNYAFAGSYGQTTGYYANHHWNGYSFVELGIGLTGKPTNVKFLASTSVANTSQFMQTAGLVKIYDYDESLLGNATYNTH